MIGQASSSAIMSDSSQQEEVVKLTYFDIPGVAQPIRIAFHMGGIDFIDQRVQFSEWPAMKKDVPFGKLPMLQIGSATYSQTGAMIRHAARVGGTTSQLWPDDDVLALRCDALCVGMIEAIDAYRHDFKHVALADKLAFRRVLVLETLPALLEPVLVELCASPGPYLLGEQLYACDLVAAGMVEALRRLSPTLLSAAYPQLTALASRVWAAPPVAAATKHFGGDDWLAPAAADVTFVTGMRELEDTAALLAAAKYEEMQLRMASSSSSSTGGGGGHHQQPGAAGWGGLPPPPFHLP